MSDEAITNETPEWILIKDIFRAKELQVRDGTSASMASRYANSLDKLPPVTLYNVKSIPSSKEGEGSRDGGPDGSVLLLVDGWHRVLAFEMGDDDGPRDEIQAIVHQGTWGDAPRGSRHGEPRQREGPLRHRKGEGHRHRPRGESPGHPRRSWPTRSASASPTSRRSSGLPSSGKETGFGSDKVRKTGS